MEHRTIRMECSLIVSNIENVEWNIEYETYPTENVIVPTLPKPIPWFKLEEMITQAVCWCFFYLPELSIWTFSTFSE